MVVALAALTALAPCVRAPVVNAPARSQIIAGCKADKPLQTELGVTDAVDFHYLDQVT